MVLVSINVGEKDLEYLKKVVEIKYNGVNRKFSHFMVESAKECAKEILDLNEFASLVVAKKLDEVLKETEVIPEWFKRTVIIVLMR